MAKAKPERDFEGKDVFWVIQNGMVLWNTFHWLWVGVDGKFQRQTADTSLLGHCELGQMLNLKDRLQTLHPLVTHLLVFLSAEPQETQNISDLKLKKPFLIDQWSELA